MYAFAIFCAVSTYGGKQNLFKHFVALGCYWHGVDFINHYIRTGFPYSD